MNRLLIATALAVAALSVPTTAALASISTPGHSPARSDDSISKPIPTEASGSGSDDSAAPRSSAAAKPVQAPSATSTEIRGRHAEPGDDRGVNSAASSASAEPGDDNGVDASVAASTKPGDDRGVDGVASSASAKPGDDNGVDASVSASAEPGDDRGVDASVAVTASPAPVATGSGNHEGGKTSDKSRRADDGSSHH